jgi:colanic acid biosynthesis glycosyl transferase WcaI
MKILVYGINYAPELTGTGKYTGEMSEWLAAHGHEVRVVTAPPYYPQWKVQPDYRAWRYRHEERAGCQVWRCPLWVPKRPGGSMRVLHLLSFVLTSFPILLRQLTWRPQLVFVVAPTLFGAPGGWLIARLAGGRAWLHIQDFEVDVALNLSMVRGRMTRRLALACERFWLRRFDKVSSISPKMTERLRLKGVESQKIESLPNWVDTDAVFPLPRPSAFRRKLKLDNAFVALYAGNMGEKQGLDIIVEAARKLHSNSRLIFVLAGEGSAKRRLRLDAEGLPNVVWMSLQPTERLNELLNLADVHLLPQRSGAADLVMPSKLTGMLASGRPIVATAPPGTQIAEVVSQCGHVVPPGATEKLVSALSELEQDRASARALGNHARAYACEHLDRSAILAALNERIAQ